MAVQAQADEIERVVAAALDPVFYRATHLGGAADVAPLAHYMAEGRRGRLDPTPWFSAADYLAANPDVDPEAADPFHHFLTVGAREGREVVASRHAPGWFADGVPPRWGPEDFAAGPAARAPEPTEADAAPGLDHDLVRTAVAAAFDRDYYLALNPDVGLAGMDPLEHFLATGWIEGRDPAPGFSVRHYLEDNPDVAAAGMNPFAHYLLAGRAEGRKPRHDLGFRYDIIARMTPVAQRIADAVRMGGALTPQPTEVLAAQLGARPDLHVTFSHDDYVAHSGGLQLCVRRESATFAARGIDHLHIHPAAPWLTVRRAGEPGPLGVMLNGVPLGVFSAGAVAQALAAAGPAGRRSFAIHSLLGHDPDETADILAAAGLSAGCFWLHDFASLCPSSHLRHNDVADCGGPPPGSAACGICAYGPERARHLDAHRRLFARLSLTVVAPSHTTLAFWRARSDVAVRETVVVPHAALVDRGPAPVTPPERPFRVAFLGMPTPLKGWPVFRGLIEALANDPRYQFLHLGGREDPGAPGAAFHPVVVTTARPLAMQEAVAAHEVDAALIWPLCRETFSFTAYEAAAGGAAVITGPDSGNVAAFAAEAGAGVVLADEAALEHAFRSGEILALSRNARGARIGGLAYSGLTGELVGG